MILIGDTVVVPIRFSLIRCGINEPVTNTVCVSARLLSWLPGLPATAVPANSVVTSRLISPRHTTVLMNKNYDRPADAQLWDVRSKSLELFREPNVNEPPGSIVSEAGITDRVSTLPGCKRRIGVEHVRAADCDSGAVEKTLAEAQFV